MSPPALQKACLHFAVAIRPLPGQTVCGDVHLVEHIPGGALLAVIDGAGHGKDATIAALAAAAVLRAHADEPLTRLVALCHEKLLATRGASLTLMSINALENTATWIGIGNVEGRLFHQVPEGRLRSQGVMLRGGIVGYQLPSLRPEAVRLVPGDWVVFATDGIRADFSETVTLDGTPSGLANRLLARHGRATDDALVLAAQYLGLCHE